MVLGYTRQKYNNGVDTHRQNDQKKKGAATTAATR